MLANMSASDSHITPNKTKPKKRKPMETMDGNNMMSPPGMNMIMGGVATLPKNRRPSVKRKKPDDMMMSPEREQFDMFNHPYQMQRHQEMMMLQQKAPPSYDDSINSKMNTHHQSMAAGLAQMAMTSESQYFTSNDWHQRQQSMPASMNFPHMSPPDSHTQNLSPPHHAIMSPPQSVQSNTTLSPPGGNMSSPQQMQQQTSPLKARGMMLPTSPTHMAAMRGASHHRHQTFDFADGSGQIMNPMGGYYINNPSPESPSQWTNSPQSHSDWSDGNIHSPPNYVPQQQQQQQQLFPKQSQEAVYI